jgi:ribosomal protein S16
MAIRGPKGAIPTQRGWIHPRTGELLKVQKISVDQINEWYGEPAVPSQPVVQSLHEAPHQEKEVDDQAFGYFYGSSYSNED